MTLYLVVINCTLQVLQADVLVYVTMRVVIELVVVHLYDLERCLLCLTVHSLEDATPFSSFHCLLEVLDESFHCPIA